MELSAAIPKDEREDRHDPQQAAVFGDFARVAALVDDAHDEKEHTGGDARRTASLLHDRSQIAGQRDQKPQKARRVSPKADGSSVGRGDEQQDEHAGQGVNRTIEII